MRAEDKLKVSFFLPSLEGGGAEKNVINILNTINRSTYAASLVLAEKTGDFLPQVPVDIPVIDLQVKSRAYLQVFFKLCSYLRHHRPAVVVSAFPHFNCMCILAVKCTRVKTQVLITEHVGLLSLHKSTSSLFNSWVSRYLIPWVVRWVYPHAHGIVAVSEGVARELLQVARLPKERVQVIYNPIDVEGVQAMAQVPVAFDQKEAPIMVMAGRLIRQKDYPTALAAVKLVLEKRPVQLVILGKGNQEQALKTLASSLGIDQHVVFMGFKQNPYPYIQKASVFVLSSLYEGFGNVLVEAMVLGVPVVSTACPFGPDEIITHGENGLLVPVQSPPTLAAAILKILENPLIAEKFSNAGRIRAQQFLAATITRQYENSINALV